MTELVVSTIAAWAYFALATSMLGLLMVALLTLAHLLRHR